MNESKLLTSAIRSYEAYDSLRKYVDTTVLSDLGQIIYGYIDDYYKLDPDANKVDTEIIIERATRDMPKRADVIIEYLHNLPEVSIPNVVDEYKTVKKTSLAYQLAEKLLHADFSERTLELMSELKDLETAALDAEEGVYVGGSIYDIISGLQPENLVPIYPKAINNLLGGGVPTGTHVVVFARPEVGKSLFSINLACRSLELGKRVLYISNEDPQKKMRARIITSLTRLPEKAVMRNPGEAWSKALSNNFENLTFVDRATMYPAEVGHLIDKHNPDVVVVDQLRNLIARGKVTKTEALENIAKELRGIFKEKDVVGVSVTQAGDSATDKAVLTMGDVDYSNTGIPGACDVMIGLGMDPNGNTFATLAKNKISGNHSTVAITLDNEMCNVRSC